MNRDEYADNINRSDYWSDDEISRRSSMFELFSNSPIPDNELLSNLGLFISKPEFARMLYMHHLYQKIVDIHGTIMQFGVRWGQDLALFETFRGIYEPFNMSRKIVGFDTFEGFPSISEKDGDNAAITEGNFATSAGYQSYLQQVLDIHESEGGYPHLKNYELVKGDACVTIDAYLEKNSETIVALAYFDFDLYEPTRKCLEAIKPHITKGTIIAFDELGSEKFPGETLALKEIFGLDRYKICRTIYGSVRAYIAID